MNRCRECSQKEAFVEGYLNILKETLLETTSISFGWIKGPLGIEKRSGGMMMLPIVLV